MAFELQSALPPVPPDVLDPAGRPRAGSYHGSFRTVDLGPRVGSTLSARVQGLAKRKQWQYGVVATNEVLVAFAIVDLGYASNGFVFAVDLARGELVADASFLGVPLVSARVRNRPGDGAKSRFHAPGCTMRVTRAEGTPSYLVEVHTRALRLEAVLDSASAPPPLAVVMPVKRGDVDCTQKTNLLAAAGTLRVGSRRWSLGGGYGGLDYTQGLFARDTSWRWAFALGRTSDGTPVGLNLAEGLSEASPGENALWLDRELVPLAAPRFTFDTKNPQAPWQLRTEDGALDLRFTAKGLHREERHLVVVRSHFAQVGGVFSGTVRDRAGRTHVLDAVPGVTEDQRVVW